MFNQYAKYGLQRQGMGQSPDGDTAEDRAQGVPLQDGQETEAPGQDAQRPYPGQQGQFQQAQQQNQQVMQNQQQAYQNGQNAPQQPVQPQAPLQNPQAIRPMRGMYNFQNRNPPNQRQFMNQMGRPFGR